MSISEIKVSLEKALGKLEFAVERMKVRFEAISAEKEKLLQENMDLRTQLQALQLDVKEKQMNLTPYYPNISALAKKEIMRNIKDSGHVDLSDQANKEIEISVSHLKELLKKKK